MTLLLPASDERIPYPLLTHDQREELHQWLREHRVDYTRVPVYASFDFDEQTREWRIPMYWEDADGRMRRDETGTDVRKHVIRRRELSPLPWPVYGPPRVWFNGVEIEGVRDVQFGATDG